MGSVNVGLENLVYAKLIKDEKGNIQYGPVQPFAPAIQANVDTTNEMSTLYADNGPIIVNSNIGETKVKLGISEIPQEVLSDITGQKLVKGVIVWKKVLFLHMSPSGLQEQRGRKRTPCLANQRALWNPRH
ncbi:hypothetical protein QKW52_04625 [Bacillus sonorensis]|nr:hypothetical protein [Bacillus sonorensis]